MHLFGLLFSQPNLFVFEIRFCLFILFEKAFGLVGKIFMLEAYPNLF
jgi:hypothetical protein